MTEDELCELAPAARRLSLEQHRSIRAVVVAGAERSAGGPLRSAPRHRRTAAIVVGLVAVTAGAAAAVMQAATPDPQQAASVVEDHRSLIGSAHPEGWRPELQSEAVECIAPSGSVDDVRKPDGTSVEPRILTYASEFPFTEPLRHEHLAAECTEGNDLFRGRGYARHDTAVCVRPSDGQSVVLVGIPRCDGGVRPMTDDDLALLNRRRAVEVALLAVPAPDRCPTLAAASAWAATHAHADGKRLRVEQRDEGDGCYRGIVDWRRSVVLVQAVGPQTRANEGGR